MVHATHRLLSATLTTQILIALALGAALGLGLNYLAIPALQDGLVNGLFAMLGQMFLNALQMLVVPLVVFSLLCGVVGIGDIKILGRVGGLTFVTYLATTALAVITALVFANVIGPGTGFESVHLAGGNVDVAAQLSTWDILANIVPKNPINALANGEMLQIIFYVMVVGIAVLMLGTKAKKFVEGCEFMNELAMKIVQIVMAFAPIGVFCLIARTFALEGFSLFAPVIGYLTTISLTLIFHLCVTLMVLLYVCTGLSPLAFLKKMRSAQVFAFSTSSSNATIPASMQCVTQRIGVDRSVASFGIPLGATINMDGTAIMHGVATVFLANAYGMELGLGGYMTVISISVLASIGTAGVPGVGIVMLAMVLNQLGMPLEGIAIILAVDRIVDMMRTVVNITGDAVVTTIVGQRVGKLDRAVFDDPHAGTFDPSGLEIDHEAERAFESITHQKGTV
ncbi:dicarboxylate/amino acid:cation symporter [Ruegeria sp. 2205SS24-7]|uniref:dicarboxylate/amino acid:cation symporter n=1 Tax=Ruegeria discodermiae TaxID=3064389 RepID=UPI002740DD32|nr:dicarboxylate/amino acid:cation symporter [Ruegeria sp. 2205SS24-7]MDP5216007.1 dicarboxylate/amino acid:cation symporter [Ruegeria sp. 2205SS24-7]